MPKYTTEYNFKKLIGQTVFKGALNDDKTQYDMITDQGHFAIRVSPDCCNDVWIESIIGEHELVGHTVSSVEEVEMPQPAISDDDKYYRDYLEIYGIKIHTDAGFAFFEYRNCHNGYYGGDPGCLVQYFDEEDNNV